MNREPREHALKCWPEPYDEIWSGSKRFELRQDDRGYRVGDSLRLRCYDKTEQRFTGREMLVRVTSLTRAADWIGNGAGDWVIMSIGVR